MAKLAVSGLMPVPSSSEAPHAQKFAWQLIRGAAVSSPKVCLALQHHLYCPVKLSVSAAFEVEAFLLLRSELLVQILVLCVTRALHQLLHCSYISEMCTHIASSHVGLSGARPTL